MNIEKTVGWKDLIFEDQVFLYKNHKSRLYYS